MVKGEKMLIFSYKFWLGVIIGGLVVAILHYFDLLPT